MECRDTEEDLAPTPGRASGSGVGNYVVIRTGSLHVLMAHLRQGSLVVREGARVAGGQRIAAVGNSGTTSQPHLHIELLDGPLDIESMGTLDFRASGLPFGFALPGDGTVIVPRRLQVLEAG